jgi:hypothetical protein
MPKMADEIMKELWAIKDALAKEAGYDIDKRVEIVQTRQEQRKKNSSTDLIDQQASSS